MTKLLCTAFTLSLLCSETLAQDPTTSDGWLKRGLAKQEKGDLPGAVADFSQAIKLDERNAEAYRARCLAQLRLGQDDLSRGDWAACNRLRPDWETPIYREIVDIRLNRQAIPVTAVEPKSYTSETHRAALRELLPKEDWGDLPDPVSFTREMKAWAEEKHQNGNDR